MDLRFRVQRQVWISIIGGALCGIAGALVFATLHAWIIVPIWTRMTSGIVFGATAGAAAGWMMATCFSPHLAASAGRAATSGMTFGVILWLLVAPVTGADALLRSAGIAPRYELVAVAVALIVSGGSGAAFAWYRTHSRHATIAGAAATLALTVAMAGPVPVGRSARAVGIFVAVLPAAMIGGGLLAVLVWLAQRRQAVSLQS
jgi:hypothetical protein